MNRKGKLKACYNANRYLHKAWREGFKVMLWYENERVKFQSWVEGIQVENEWNEDENEYVQGKQKKLVYIAPQRGCTIRVRKVA